MIDVFLGVVEDVVERLTRHVVAHALAVRDGLLERRLRRSFGLQVARQELDCVLSDQKFAEVLQVWWAIEQKNAFDQVVGVFGRRCVE